MPDERVSVPSLHLSPSPHPAGEICDRLNCPDAVEPEAKAIAQQYGPHFPFDANVIPAPFFENAASETLAEVSAIFSCRGGEYADSWALSNMQAPFLSAMLRDFGLRELTREEKRILMLAVLVDVKDQRLGGPWKRDSLIDGIAYRAALGAARDRYVPPVQKDYDVVTTCSPRDPDCPDC